MSRWVIDALLSRYKNSIGFSSVTMCSRLCSFIQLIMAAIVELLPEPVTPVTRTMPRSLLAILLIIGGSPRSSTEGISMGIDRRTIIGEPRCFRMFTRNRPIPGIPHEQS